MQINKSQLNQLDTGWQLCVAPMIDGLENVVFN
jgi:hypothetical protein